MTIPLLDNKLIQHTGSIISCEQIASNTFLHEYKSPEIARSARPGQFVQIRITTDFSPLFPRPMSVLDVDGERGSISVLFKIFGEATAQLAEKEEGDSVGLLGPLGNTFLTEPYKNLYLVAGGIGFPPLYFLTQSLDLSQFHIILLFGAASKEDLILTDEINKINIEKEFATEDGSFGAKGFITIPLEKILKEKSHPSDTCIMACGPIPMLVEVQRLAHRYNVDAQLSVETIMACGIGICQGCVLPNRGENGKVCGYRLVCTEGPVFSGNDLVLENG